jgi:glycosyl transferase family 2
VKDVVLTIATHYWRDGNRGWRDCVQSWLTHSVTNPALYFAAKMPVVEAYQWAYEHTSEPIIGMVHDDVMIYEGSWDARVLKEFEDPTIGMVGFGGALGHGTPNLYQVPYHLPNLARQHFLSNMQDAEKHGGRFTGERDVAVLDGFALFVRRRILDKWGGWPDKRGGWPHGTPVGYFMYSENLCCETRRQGYRIRLVGVDCEHLGGKSSAHIPTSPSYEEEHAYFYARNRDVMPYRVKE